MLQPTPKSELDTLTPYLRAANVQDRHLNLSDIKQMYCSPSEMAGLALRTGDLLVCEGGDVGRVALVSADFDIPTIFQNSVHRVVPTTALDSRFLFYVLQAFYLERSYYSVLCSASTIRHLTVEKLQRLQIPLPTLAQQRQIAGFLDEQVSLLDRAVDLKRRQKSLIVERHDAEVERRLRPDGSKTPETQARYLVQNIGVGIVVQPAALYSDEDDAVPAVRGKDISPGRVEPTASLVRISKTGHDANPRSALRDGDVLVVRSGKAGAAAQVPAELIGGNCIDVVLVRPGPGLDARYLEYSINCLRAQESILEHSAGAIQKHFGVEDMKALPVVPRSLHEQMSVARTLDSMTDHLRRTGDMLDRSISLLSERKQALITAAVTGQFDVTAARSAV